MELIEIKEILRKASVEVEIQGRGKVSVVSESDFERVAVELVEKSKQLCDSCNREKHLQKLTDQAQDLGLGYDD